MAGHSAKQVDARVDQVQGEVFALRNEVTAVADGQGSLKTEVSTLTSGQASLQTDVSAVKEEVARLSSGTQSLREDILGTVTKEYLDLKIAEIHNMFKDFTKSTGSETGTSSRDKAALAPKPEAGEAAKALATHGASPPVAQATRPLPAPPEQKDNGIKLPNYSHTHDDGTMVIVNMKMEKGGPNVTTVGGNHDGVSLLPPDALQEAMNMLERALVEFPKLPDAGLADHNKYIQELLDFDQNNPHVLGEFREETRSLLKHEMNNAIVGTSYLFTSLVQAFDSTLVNNFGNILIDEPSLTGRQIAVMTTLKIALAREYTLYPKPISQKEQTKEHRRVMDAAQRKTQGRHLRGTSGRSTPRNSNGHQTYAAASDANEHGLGDERRETPTPRPESNFRLGHKPSFRTRLSLDYPWTIWERAWKHHLLLVEAASNGLLDDDVKLQLLIDIGVSDALRDQLLLLNGEDLNYDGAMDHLKRLCNSRGKSLSARNLFGNASQDVAEHPAQFLARLRELKEAADVSLQPNEQISMKEVESRFRFGLSDFIKEELNKMEMFKVDPPSEFSDFVALVTNIYNLHQPSTYVPRMGADAKPSETRSKINGLHVHEASVENSLLHVQDELSDDEGEHEGFAAYTVLRNPIEFDGIIPRVRNLITTKFKVPIDTRILAPWWKHLESALKSFTKTGGILVIPVWEDKPLYQKAIKASKMRMRLEPEIFIGKKPKAYPFEALFFEPIETFMAEMDMAGRVEGYPVEVPDDIHLTLSGSRDNEWDFEGYLITPDGARGAYQAALDTGPPPVVKSHRLITDVWQALGYQADGSGYHPLYDNGITAVFNTRDERPWYPVRIFADLGAQIDIVTRKTADRILEAIPTTSIKKITPVPMYGIAGSTMLKSMVCIRLKKDQWSPEVTGWFYVLENDKTSWDILMGLPLLCRLGYRGDDQTFELGTKLWKSPVVIQVDKGKPVQVHAGELVNSSSIANSGVPGSAFAPFVNAITLPNSYEGASLRFLSTMLKRAMNLLAKYNRTNPGLVYLRGHRAYNDAKLLWQAAQAELDKEGLRFRFKHKLFEEVPLLLPEISGCLPHTSSDPSDAEQAGVVLQMLMSTLDGIHLIYQQGSPVPDDLVAKLERARLLIRLAEGYMKGKFVLVHPVMDDPVLQASLKMEPLGMHCYAIEFGSDDARATEKAPQKNEQTPPKDPKSKCKPMKCKKLNEKWGDSKHRNDGKFAMEYKAMSKGILPKHVRESISNEAVMPSQPQPADDDTPQDDDAAAADETEDAIHSLPGNALPVQEVEPLLQHCVESYNAEIDACYSSPRFVHPDLVEVYETVHGTEHINTKLEEALKFVPPDVGQLLREYEELLHYSGQEPWWMIDTSIPEHEKFNIRVKDPSLPPHNCAPFPIPPKHQAYAERRYDMLLKHGWVTNGSGPYCCSVFFKSKKQTHVDGIARELVNYVPANLNTVRDQFPISLISTNLQKAMATTPLPEPFRPQLLVPIELDETRRQQTLATFYSELDHTYTYDNDCPKPSSMEMGLVQYPICLDDLKHESDFCLSSLDMPSGYDHGIMSAFAAEFAAIVLPFALFNVWTLKQGLANAPAFFQRMMTSKFQSCMMGDNAFVLIYLDDILIYSPDRATHLVHLKKVFDIMRQHKLRISVSKSSFCMKTLKWLGHIITPSGLRPDPELIDVIASHPVPSNRTEMRSFLGIANFFRDFIEDFSVIASPLTSLTSKASAYHWTPKCTEAFLTLKRKLTSAPTLVKFDIRKVHELHTDASTSGGGAVLYQLESDMHLHPVGFASFKWSKSQANYSVYKQELLALVTALKKFSSMLLGVKFTVATDNKAVCGFIQTSQNQPSSIMSRWREYVDQFNFDIKYLPGKNNVVPDALSRTKTEPLVIWDLCSGLSSVLQSLEWLALSPGIPIVYRAVEVDPKLRNLILFHFTRIKDTINFVDDDIFELGNDVRRIVPEKHLAPSLILAGVPCQSVSRANPNAQGLSDKRQLFTAVAELLQYFKEAGHKVDFVIECTRFKSTLRKDLAAVNQMMGCRPVLIDFARFCSQRRERKLWMSQPKIAYAQPSIIAPTMQQTLDPGWVAPKVKSSVLMASKDTWNVRNGSFTLTSVDGTQKRLPNLREKLKMVTFDQEWFQPAILTEDEMEAALGRAIPPRWWYHFFLHWLRHLLVPGTVEQEDDAPSFNRMEASGYPPFKNIREINFCDIYPMPAFQVNFLTISQLSEQLDFDVIKKYKDSNLFRLDENTGLYYLGQRIVLDDVHARRLIDHLHETLGHSGPHRIIQAIRSSGFHIPEATSKVRRRLQTCHTCQMTQSSRYHSRAADYLAPDEVPAYPFEQVHLDILTIEACDEYSGVILAVDAFSRFVIARPCTSHVSHEDVYRFIMEEIVLKWGAPKRIVTDMGKQFNTTQMKEMRDDLQIKGIFTAPFHAQSNGAAERQHSTLLKILRSFAFERPNNWVDELQCAIFAMNYCCSSSTGFSPFFVLHGYHPRLPSSYLVDYHEPEFLSDYLQQHEQRKQTFKLIVDKLTEENNKIKESHKPLSKFQVGDFIKVRQVPRSLKLKATYYGPYKIIQTDSNNNVVLELPKLQGVQQGLRISPKQHIDRLLPYHIRPGSIPPLNLLRRFWLRRYDAEGVPSLLAEYSNNLTFWAEEFTWDEKTVDVHDSQYGLLPECGITGINRTAVRAYKKERLSRKFDIEQIYIDPIIINTWPSDWAHHDQVKTGDPVVVAMYPAREVVYQACIPRGTSFLHVACSYVGQEITNTQSEGSVEHSKYRLEIGDEIYSSSYEVDVVPCKHYLHDKCEWHPNALADL